MAYRILIFLLLIVPLSFKIEILPGVRFLLIEPFIAFFVFACLWKFSKIKTKSLPFLFLVLSLLVIAISTIVSLFFYFDVIGLIKCFKYMLYAIAIFTLLNYPQHLNVNIIDKILKYGFLCVLLSLTIYFINFFIIGKSWSHYVSMSTWISRFMPTGLSNVTFDLQTLSFYRSGGNHGIYGSYLVMLLILAIYQFFKYNYKKYKLLILLILVNLSFITSREAIMLLMLTISFYTIHHFLIKNWINRKILLYSGIGLILFLLVFIIWSPEIVILHKINYMVKNIAETGGLDRSVNFRFNTWYLLFSFFLMNPQNLLLGIGYNRTRLGNILDNQERVIGQELFHVDLPESIYVATLGYGGIFSLIFFLIFLVTLFYLLYEHSGKLGKIFSFFLIALAISNATGASLFAELMLSQFGLISSILIYKGQSNELNKKY